MKVNPDSFYGQQEGETILYTLIPHPLTLWLALSKLYLGALALIVTGQIITAQLPAGFGGVAATGSLTGLALAVLGTMAVMQMRAKSRSYITDRRIIRFYAHNPFATAIRSLNWDQAVKVKTFPPNIVFKMARIGTVIVHSKSTIINNDQPIRENMVNNDDIELEEVFYYKDLGNYIDKIIYLYNRQPANLKNLKPFIPKPKGLRY